jgi:tRNA A37 threonylcarbamoyladenosine modification protein TsaB
MKFLYMIIVAGFGLVYYITQKDKKEKELAIAKEGIEASYAQEAPPSKVITDEKSPEELAEEAYIKKFIPNYN